MTDVPTIRAFLEERHVALAAEAEGFAAREIAPLPAPADDAAARTQAREILRKLGRAGLIRHAVPAAYGGAPHGPDLRACALVRESLAAASPLADAVFALQCLGSMPITIAGSEALRQRWLPAIAAGEAMAAFVMTEREAGSDVASLRTTARREGDAYVLDGAKTLISNAGIADVHCVFASTDPAKGGKGVSCFVVEGGAPGLRFAGAQVLSAPHPLGEIRFEGCRVPAASRLGDEGAGLKIGYETLDRLRATVAAAACGMAARALDEAVAHARSRRQFGKPLGDLELVQEKIARSATDLAASRLLVYRAAWEKDRAGDARVTVPSAMAKAFATEAAQRIVDDAVQVLGGIGVLASHPVERLYRAVRALRIYEGTTEIQHLVIASHLLKEGK
ncbi:MAG: acyl-CoA dehydrogenase family protein [Planctomycetales bacterium]|nr:acyl-CoA dehydrogenase family protein [Planctomycetales bacterium]